MRLVGRKSEDAVRIRVCAAHPEKTVGLEEHLRRPAAVVRAAEHPFASAAAIEWQLSHGMPDNWNSFS